jgi:hypothetical protein
MSVRAIDKSKSAIKYNQQQNPQQNHQQSFTGSFNPVVTVMDAIERGGFAASFISQDGIGMVAPRIYEGLNRNRQKDENGKKTGPLNWEFARREGIREILSGPSAFLIPLGILSVIKKTSGTANNVRVDHINTLGNEFATYLSKNPAQISNPSELKKGYYAQVFENTLFNSTEKSLQGAELKSTAEKFANKLVEIEDLRTNKKGKDAKKLYAEFVEEYTKLRKSTTSASSDELGAILNAGNNKTLNTNFKRLTQGLTDYTNDAIKNVNKHLTKNSNENIGEYIKKFNAHRAGTRVLSNLGMWSAVVVFYTLIPKLYNLGIKQDPGLKGLAAEENDKNKDKNKDVTFTGGIPTKLGDIAAKGGKAGKLLNNFEFNGASMSVPAMLTLLFGFCLPPRYANAKSDKERKEILVRDISSFTAILFGAKALSRAFSTAFAKVSGLALNIKPDNHNKSFLHKFKNYFSAGSGINVLSSDQIVTKYSNLTQYKDRINGFFTFLQENGGDVKKVLKLDKTVKEQSEEILRKFGGGKNLQNASIDDIRNAFKKAEHSKELELIYTIFTNKDNKFINRAKTYNSAFGFASTLVLVPAFMMWLARYCEKMTKKAVAKEQNQKAQDIQQAVQVKPIIANAPSMAGFLNNKS